MASIQITGQDILNLQNKYKQAMVLRKKGEPKLEYSDWLKQELSIDQIRSPKGMWSQEHELVFESEAAMLEFKFRHMG